MKSCFKKAQIGMIEMIMVMIVVVVIIVIGMVFYFKFSGSSMEKTQERISEDKAAVIISSVAQLPEIECSHLKGRGAKGCVDTLKLLVLSMKDKEGNPDFVEHRRHYSDLFGYMVISVEQLHPQTSGKECDISIFGLPDYPEAPPIGCGNWTIYNNPKKGAGSVFRTMPVALYYPTNRAYTLGQLKVTIY
ncbi:hypothetical protein FJZ53_02995 [Candidatus Woesearchaeota archaeon]|nr:hypothetical protein [Candidatus Woesearchaeota archaeon]